MTSRWSQGARALAGAVGLLCVTAPLWAGPPGEAPAAPGETPAKAGAKPEEKVKGEKTTVAVARERARLMHDLYSSTLDAMHHHYFRTNRAMIPARAMEDVFEEMSERWNVESRWIAVNTQAMGVDHKPQDDFEKKAARELGAGKDSIEVVEDGAYRRAGAIPLGSGCVSCHAGFFAGNAKTPRFAGLVISVPLDEE